MALYKHSFVLKPSVLNVWCLTLVFLKVFKRRLPRGGYHPCDFEIDTPKVKLSGSILWDRVSSLSIDTKILKVGQRMTSKWRNKKHGRPENFDFQRNIGLHVFFAKKKIPTIGLSPVWCGCVFFCLFVCWVVCLFVSLFCLIKKEMVFLTCSLSLKYST